MPAAKYSHALQRVLDWFKSRDMEPFGFQKRAWEAQLKGKSGLIHTKTGTGKTYAALFGPVIKAMSAKKSRKRGLRILWITPLRALAADTLKSLSLPVKDLLPEWEIDLRTADVSQAKRVKQSKRLPEVFITTPESLSILITYPNFAELIESLEAVILDEWHELLGSKRGVLTELALARVKKIVPGVSLWGLSATLGNTQKALEVLLGKDSSKGVLIGDTQKKEVEIHTIVPSEIDKFPWAGHLGIVLLPAVLEVINSSRSSLLFTNTRSQAEIWFQSLLDADPDLAGQTGLHHGSIDKKERQAVEYLLDQGKMKCVVCTSSLDLGVDFSPVDTVIQVGSPKGIARLLQRAGRSGHKPGGVSRIYCVPTNSLELLEFSSAREGIKRNFIEPRTPVLKPLDVLAQHAVSVAIGSGFEYDDFYAELKSSHAYADLTKAEFDWVIDFITRGGPTLTAYDDFSKVKSEGSRFVVTDSHVIRRHRMSVGTITSEAEILVKYMSGGRVGAVEESFVSKLKAGDSFIFAGKVLEYVKLRDMTLYVKKSNAQGGPIPQWMGGRMPLSNELSLILRERLDEAGRGIFADHEMKKLKPLIDLQKSWSAVPAKNKILAEHKTDREGLHLFIYPFEGKLVHEGLASLVAYRLSQYKKSTFTLSTNDYGFEVLSSEIYTINDQVLRRVLSTENLLDDILLILNTSEMAKRKFRDIARVTGLVFQGYPGSGKTPRQVQASSSLFYEVFRKYDPENMLIKQAVREVLENQLEQMRLTSTLKRISESELQIIEPENFSPLAFPLLVDRLRETLTTERLSERVSKMKLRLEKEADRKPGIIIRRKNAENRNK
ncbi:MAG: ligase-associated DNA damage response DEXH box helicase [Ignavibacteriaceae bacterium]|nr:ligase-associated DNA damage response DEXH box helicase [Ignavibacteriaceae bacterium]